MTVATGTGATVKEVWACLPPALAVSWVCPGATPVTAPFALTVAIVVDPVLHVTGPVAIGLPFWSRPSTDALAVWPTKMVVWGNDKLSVVRTGAGGAIVSVPPPPHERIVVLTRVANATRASFCIFERRRETGVSVLRSARAIVGAANDSGVVRVFLCRFHITEMHFSITSMNVSQRAERAVMKTGENSVRSRSTLGQKRTVVDFPPKGFCPAIRSCPERPSFAWPSAV